jgi:GNAT superfamily N-acetyltransferase
MRPAPDHVVIRERMQADDAAIRRLNDDAFGGTYESRLIEDLRSAGLDAVELVAVEDDQIVGHILFSVLATSVDRHAVPALALAPMAVRPDRQRRGIGSALVRAASTWRATKSGGPSSCWATRATIRASAFPPSWRARSRQLFRATPSWHWNSRSARCRASKAA